MDNASLLLMENGAMHIYDPYWNTTDFQPLMKYQFEDIPNRFIVETKSNVFYDCWNGRINKLKDISIISEKQPESNYMDSEKIVILPFKRKKFACYNGFRINVVDHTPYDDMFSDDYM